MKALLDYLGSLAHAIITPIADMIQRLWTVTREMAGGQLLALVGGVIFTCLVLYLIVATFGAMDDRRRKQEEDRVERERLLQIEKEGQDQGRFFAEYVAAKGQQEMNIWGSEWA